MRKRASLVGAMAGAALWALPTPLQGQSIADRVAEVRDGKVRLSFASRPEVCGDGHRSISLDGGRGWHIRRGSSDDWEVECEHGPARVVLFVRDGEVTEIDTYVGGRWRPAGANTLDLGDVASRDAAAYLLGLARRDAPGAKHAILPAMLADGVEVWPELLEIARDGSLRRDTRKSAIFWLGQEAGGAATAGLDAIVYDDSNDREIRKSAIFALSQRPNDEGVPALIRVARTNPDPALVKNALFWLAESGDPRAIKLFEELLTRR